MKISPAAAADQEAGEDQLEPAAVVREAGEDQPGRDGARRHRRWS